MKIEKTVYIDAIVCGDLLNAFSISDTGCLQNKINVFDTITENTLIVYDQLSPEQLDILKRLCKKKENLFFREGSPPDHSEEAQLECAHVLYWPKTGLPTFSLSQKKTITIHNA